MKTVKSSGKTFGHRVSLVKTPVISSVSTDKFKIDFHKVLCLYLTQFE